MAKVLVVYYSRTGNTEQMARCVAEGAGTASASVTLKRVEDTRPDDLLDADAIVIGSPVYYGLPAAPIKALLDESVVHHGRLQGKVGAAFATSGCLGGGNETTVLAILQMLLVHGMVVQGNASGDHYGPVAIGAPDERARRQCVLLGRRVAELALKLSRTE